MVRGKYAVESSLALLFFLVFAIYALALPLYLIPSHFPRSYNEGWNAYHAAAAMSGGGLYPPADSMLANNYPPLSFYLVGIVGKIVGDYIVAGRLISVISLGIVTYNVFRLCQWLGAGKSLAAVGAGAFLMEIATLSATYIAMDDPQFLAHAFITSAAVIFLNASPQLGSRMLLAATLVVAGGLVKHNVVSLPLALCTWAAFYDRKRLYIFLLWLFAIGSIALALLYGMWGRILVDSVLFHARVTTMERAVKISLGLLPRLVPLMLLTIGACIWLRSSRQSLFLLAYFLWASVTSFLMLSGDGVILNIIFDVVIAIVIGSVAFVFALEKKEGHNSEYSAMLRKGALLTLALSALGFYFAQPKQQHFLSKSVETLNYAREWSALADRLARTNGPVACEMLSICYWAQKPPEVDFFNYSQKVKTGRISDSEFRDKLHSHYYRFVLIELLFKNPTTRLPREIEEQLFLNYEPVWLVAGGSGLLLAPLPQSLDELDKAESANSP